jgi:hypothetical protein
MCDKAQEDLSDFLVKAEIFDYSELDDDQLQQISEEMADVSNLPSPEDREKSILTLQSFYQSFVEEQETHQTYRLDTRNQQSINYCDPEDNGRTGAHKAAIDNDIHKLQQLIEQGIDLFIRDNHEHTAFSLARDKNHHEIVLLLKQAMQAQVEKEENRKVG